MIEVSGFPLGICQTLQIFIKGILTLFLYVDALSTVKKLLSCYLRKIISSQYISDSMKDPHVKKDDV